MSVEEKRGKIDIEIKVLPVSRQCELLGLSRSAYYYQPVISQENIRLMSLIDEEFTAHPFYGKRRICGSSGKCVLGFAKALDFNEKWDILN